MSVKQKFVKRNPLWFNPDFAFLRFWLNFVAIRFPPLFKYKVMRCWCSKMVYTLFVMCIHQFRFGRVFWKFCGADKVLIFCHDYCICFKKDLRQMERLNIIVIWASVLLIFCIDWQNLDAWFGSDVSTLVHARIIGSFRLDAACCRVQSRPTFLHRYIFFYLCSDTIIHRVTQQKMQIVATSLHEPFL